MEKDKVQDYINKLMELNNEISEDSDTDDNSGDLDDNFIQTLNHVLVSLNKDVENEMMESITNVKPDQPVFYTKVKVKKLHPNAVIPSYSKDGDAGMDLTITSVIENTSFSVSYGFGIALEIPKGYVGLVFPRSSIRKYDLLLSNSVGVIDSGYRGEIQATFKKTNGLDSFKYNTGERGAQIVILPYPQIKMVESTELSDTERGEGGFGSTGS
jgi:dUTP pyrophosphatase